MQKMLIVIHTIVNRLTTYNLSVSYCFIQCTVHTCLQRGLPPLLRLPAICSLPVMPLVLTGSAMSLSSRLVYGCLSRRLTHIFMCWQMRRCCLPLSTKSSNNSLSLFSCEQFFRKLKTTVIHPQKD